LIAAIGLAFPTYAPLLPRGSVYRIEAILQGREDTSTSARHEANLVAIEEIQKDPIGMGFGGFGRIYSFGLATDQIYPHNLVVEIAVENGFIVAIIFVGITGMALLNSYRAARRNVELQPFFAILVLASFYSLISGELNESRWLYTLIVIGLQMPGLVAKASLDQVPGTATVPIES
jgi:O-antigen ligase